MWKLAGILVLLGLTAGSLRAAAAECQDWPMRVGKMTLEQVQDYLAAGADPNARNARGATPWDVAQGNASLRGTPVWPRLRAAQKNR